MTEAPATVVPRVERSGRQVERDFALVNLRRLTWGTALSAAAVVGMISVGLAAQAAAATRPVAFARPTAAAAVVVVQYPVAVIVRVPVPVYVNASSTITSARRASVGSATRVATAAPGVGSPPAGSPPAAAPPRPAPTPPPQPVCTSSPSLCP